MEIEVKSPDTMPHNSEHSIPCLLNIEVMSTVKNEIFPKFHYFRFLIRAMVSTVKNTAHSEHILSMLEYGLSKVDINVTLHNIIITIYSS